MLYSVEYEWWRLKPFLIYTWTFRLGNIEWLVHIWNSFFTVLIPSIGAVSLISRIRLVDHTIVYSSQDDHSVIQKLYVCNNESIKSQGQSLTKRKQERKQRERERGGEKMREKAKLSRPPTRRCPNIKRRVYTCMAHLPL